MGGVRESYQSGETVLLGICGMSTSLLSAERTLAFENRCTMGS